MAIITGAIMHRHVQQPERQRVHQLEHQHVHQLARQHVHQLERQHDHQPEHQRGKQADPRQLNHLLYNSQTHHQVVSQLECLNLHVSHPTIPDLVQTEHPVIVVAWRFQRRRWL